MKIHLVDFKEPQFQNYTFDPFLHAFFISLKKLGHDVSLAIRETDDTAINIFFAFHRVFADNFKFKLPKKTIIFNLEPLHERTNIDRFKKYNNEISKNFPIIDYSYKNHKFLDIKDCYIFKFGFFNFGLHYLSNTNNKITFIGTLNQRRVDILNQLHSKKVDIVAINNLWGIHRDNELIKSKSIINICKNEKSILEIYRIWHALCLGVPVISEMGIDKRLVDDWEKYVFFTPNLLSFDYQKYNNAKCLLYKETSFENEVLNLSKWINEIFSS